MAEFELVMPKMGESIMEATILKWLKNEGDPVEEDETILEIATDKVDSEIPSPIQGTIKEVFYPEDSVVAVGEIIALIATESLQSPESTPPQVATPTAETRDGQSGHSTSEDTKGDLPYQRRKHLPAQHEGRFYSPLVRSIAQKEGLSINELSTVNGSG